MAIGCAFSGHRTIKQAHRAKISPLIARAIESAYGEGCRTFYSGGAVGFDTLAAQQVIRFRMTHPDVRLVLYLPCVDQDAKWNDAQKNMYAHLIQQTDEVIYISDSYTPSCIKKRNEALATVGDIMICYLSHRSSGTGQTVSLAQSLGQRVYNLYPSLEGEK